MTCITENIHPYIFYKIKNIIVYSKNNKKIAPKAFYSSKYEFTYSYIYKCTLEMKPWHNFTIEHFFFLHMKLNACFKINTYFRNKVSHNIHDMG